MKLFWVKLPKTLPHPSTCFKGRVVWVCLEKKIFWYLKVAVKLLEAKITHNDISVGYYPYYCFSKHKLRHKQFVFSKNCSSDRDAPRQYQKVFYVLCIVCCLLSDPADVSGFDIDTILNNQPQLLLLYQ